MGLVIAVATIASYGTIWWILGFRAAGHGSWLSDVVGVVLLALLVGAARKRMRDESPERRRERAIRGNIIGIVTGILAVLIAIALNVLRHAGRIDLLTPVISIIVGLHFLAFARLFPARIYYVTSALLVGLGAAGCLLPAGSGRVIIVSIGAACILWLTCVAVLIRPESRRSGS